MTQTEANVSCPLSRLRERVGVRADAKDKARALRAQMTDAETLMWQQLRGRRFQGFKFRRQRPLGPYILDFVCLEAGLVIEIDGGQHAEQLAYDQARTALIESHQLTVILEPRSDERHRSGAGKHLADVANPHPCPLPHAGEGVIPNTESPTP